MAGVIMTGNFPKALWPGIKAWFGMAYDELPPQWPDLFDKDTSKQAFEEEVQASGFPQARVKPQGEAVKYVSHNQGYTVRYTHIVWALGFIVSWEEQINNLYEQVAKFRSKSLAFSMRQAKETNCANFYNLGFTTNHADGVPFLSDSHPSFAGLQSNILAAAADLSESALEDMMIQIMNAQDNVGNHIGLQGLSLHVPSYLWYEANRIMKSVLTPDTSNNAVNVLRATNALPKGIKVNNYFSDVDNWFVRTNCPHGLKVFERVGLDFREDNDFDTRNRKYASDEYYSVGGTDWRSLYGSAPS